MLLNIDSGAEAVHEMERQMRINEDVLRYLTIRVDALEEGPSAIMQNRGGRDERPRRDDRPRREPRGGRREHRDRDFASGDARPAGNGNDANGNAGEGGNQ